MERLTSNQVLENFIAQFFINGLSAEEAEEKGWNGSEFDFQRNKRLTAISSKVQKVVNFFKDNALKLTDDSIDDVFHKTEVVQREVYDYKTETTSRENRVVEAGIIQKGFCIGFTKVDRQNCQYGVFCDQKNVFAFRRFNGTGAIVEAYKMSF